MTALPEPDFVNGKVYLSWIYTEQQVVTIYGVFHSDRQRADLEGFFICSVDELKL